ncbi:MAG: ComEC/Rec2 family competence protein [Bacillota bacterium]|nr:ComEC/Rec2 family competence protein [Bacillota bacterium]
MSLPSPVELALPYLGGLALGAVLRKGYPADSGAGLAVAGSLALGSVLVTWAPRRPGSRRRGGTERSWYMTQPGRHAGESFWRPSPVRRRFTRGALLLALWLAGAGRMWLSLGPPPPPLEELARQFPEVPGRREVVVCGTVVAAPEPGSRGWQVLLRPEGSAGRSGLIRLTVGGSRSATDYSRLFQVGPGARLTAPVKLYRPVPANPGELPFGGTCTYGRLVALGWVPVYRVQLEAGSRGAGAIADGLRQRLVAFLGRGAHPPGRGILRALLLGDGSELPDDVAEDFARAGAMHLLVVSGLHLSVAAAFLGEAASRLGFGRRGRAALAAAGALGYASLTGWDPPVTRAALMAVVAQGAAWCGRQPDTGRALWLTVLAMLVHRPLLFFDAGFRLTVAATWGVAALGPLLVERLGATGAVARGWCTALGAQVTTLPLVLQYFGRAPLVATAASPVLVEAGAVVVEAGCAAGALGLALPPLAAPLSAGLGVAASVLWWMARLVGRIPWATVNLPGPPEWVAVLYYAALGAGWRALRAGDLSWPFAASPARLLVAAAAGVVWAACAGGLSPWLQCTFLSVGEGDALHLRLPGGPLGPHLVVDTGSSPGRLLAYLRRSAVQSLETVVVTHAHRDHSGGLAGVRRSLPVGRVIAPGAGGGRAETAAGARVLVTPAVGRGDENENSRRVVVRYGRFCLLITGDAPLTADDPALAGLPPRGTPDGSRLFLVVKIPHHGARRAVAPEFLDAYQPDLAVVSVGPNGYGHPDPDLLALLGRKRIPVWRTDEKGAIRVESDGERVRLRAFGSGAAPTAGTASRRRVRCSGAGRR